MSASVKAFGRDARLRGALPDIAGDYRDALRSGLRLFGCRRDFDSLRIQYMPRLPIARHAMLLPPTAYMRLAIGGFI